jgi:hypothetical protein
MDQVQETYKQAEEIYQSELINLAVTKQYPKTLMQKEAVRSYTARHALEILTQFELAMTKVRMDEAAEHVERVDGSSRYGSTAQTHQQTVTMP